MSEASCRGYGLIVALACSGVFSTFLLLTACSEPTKETRLAYKAPAGNVGEESASSELAIGQVVYVPAYSHIYHQDGRPHPLTVTLSVRNTNRKHQIVIKAVTYYDSAGKKLREYLDKPLTLAPLATTAFLVKRDDTSGGVGASFIVEWNADSKVAQPIIETVMIDTSSQQGLSFARAGTELIESEAIDLK